MTLLVLLRGSTSLLPSKTRDLVPLPSFPPVLCVESCDARCWRRTGGNRRSLRRMNDRDEGRLPLLMDHACDLSCLDIYSLDIYIYIFRVRYGRFIDTGMWDLEGSILWKLCYIYMYKYRFRFVVGWIERNDVTGTGESRSVSILFHLICEVQWLVIW